VPLLIATSPQYIETSPVLRRFATSVHVIPFVSTPIDLIAAMNRQLPRCGVKYGPRLILAVGRLVYYKGSSIGSGDAFSKWASTDRRRRPLRDSLRTLAVRSGWQTASHLWPDNREDLVPYFHASDLFVLPSIARSEASGLCSSKPWQAVNRSSIRLWIPAFLRITGRYHRSDSSPADALSLATAINKLLDDNDLRSRYG